MKDYLSHVGYEEREAIKRAYSMELIADGGVWHDALSDRNLTVHTYDEAQATEIYNSIRNLYFGLLQELYTKFKDLI